MSHTDRCARNEDARYVILALRVVLTDGQPRQPPPAKEVSVGWVMLRSVVVVELPRINNNNMILEKVTRRNSK